MRGDAAILAKRADGDQPRPGFGDGGRRRRVEPAQLTRIDDTPARTVKHDGHQIVLVDLRRVEGRHPRGRGRSEEHTSELQSLMRISYAVFCLKKKKQYNNTHVNHHTRYTQLIYTEQNSLVTQD